MAKFVQCILRKGNRTRERWIPKQHAKIGKFLRIQINGAWSYDWEVAMLGSEKDFDIQFPSQPSIVEKIRSWLFN
jgi:hypothetical protein